MGLGIGGYLVGERGGGDFKDIECEQGRFIRYANVTTFLSAFLLWWPLYFKEIARDSSCPTRLVRTPFPYFLFLFFDS